MSPDLFSDTEGQLQDVSDVIIFHPQQTLVKLRVQGLHIRQGDRTVDTITTNDKNVNT